MTEENGPLLVVPGSHRTKSWQSDSSGAIQKILAEPGDVLLIRPLVVHSSNNSVEGTWRHRRIVHLEFAPAGPLPDGFEWHDFRPISGVLNAGSTIEFSRSFG